MAKTGKIAVITLASLGSAVIGLSLVSRPLDKLRTRSRIQAYSPTTEILSDHVSGWAFSGSGKLTCYDAEYRFLFRYDYKRTLFSIRETTLPELGYDALRGAYHACAECIAELESRTDQHLDTVLFPDTRGFYIITTERDDANLLPLCEAALETVRAQQSGVSFTLIACPENVADKLLSIDRRAYLTEYGSAARMHGASDFPQLAVAIGGNSRSDFFAYGDTPAECFAALEAEGEPDLHSAGFLNAVGFVTSFCYDAGQKTMYAVNFFTDY